MEPIEVSETSAFKPQTPGKYPKENILHKEHGESLKSRSTHTLANDGPLSILWLGGKRYNSYPPLTRSGRASSLFGFGLP